jgi:hypothetical protein
MVINGESTQYPASLSVDTSVTPPPPVFGCKILVFMRLQEGLRYKILITKKLPAKSSWIRSYALFLASCVVSQKFIEEQPQILRLTTPRLKSTPGAPFAQDDSYFAAANFDNSFCDAYF